ncbi:helix-turn-helix domain-containing protein [Streptomyces sp. CC208A]|uniref:winged helix-turn-helix transcriptional regulator n=1 Tax=Streptomyces sp. CC208A TaxID=3044573 RepID=UPI0024A7C352|nr:helix-turn-helix domain-containing protein [Streptomyces sp. CC208A]
MARIRLDDGGVCGVAAAISVLDGKWKTLLLWLLESGPHRPGELRRKVPRISEKVLTQALREMEEDGLVHRETHEVVPLRTVYSLTGHGLALSRALAPLSDWGHDHLDRLAETRDAS